GALFVDLIDVGPSCYEKSGSVGVLFHTRSELLCARMSIAEAAKAIEADSLEFLSEESLLKAGNRSELCMACFNGCYPTSLYQNKIEEDK
nr:hypothetical protein [Alistipes sp.]